MAFFVGQLVVRVSGGRYGGYGDEIRPVLGCVYTVRRLGVVSGVAALWLVEVVNAPRSYTDGFHEAAFPQSAFRPAKLASKEVFDSLTAPIRNMKRVGEGERV